MRVYNLYNEIPNLTEKTAVALGFFDGVHVAHREVIAAVTATNLVPTVLTFSLGASAPKSKLNIKTILTQEQKLVELEKLGVSITVSPSFDDIDSIEAEEFFEEILLKKLNAGFISCGYDYKFGHGAKGDIELLQTLCQKHNITLNITKKLEQNGKVISSTALREALCNGEVKLANSLLGYRYYIKSRVEHGKKIGSTIGFPTINQELSDHQIILKHGVYKTETKLCKAVYKSITNVGVKPTIDGERKPLAETYILGFDGDVYGENITVSFEEFIRDERKFSSIDELKAQIALDIKRAMQ